MILNSILILATMVLPTEFDWVNHFEKYEGNPIIRPQGEWAADMIFNAAAIVKDGRVGLLCRAINLKERPKNRAWSVSSLIWAWSDDGYNFKLDEKPFMHPTAAWDVKTRGECPYNGGFEDPRLVYIAAEKLYVLTYTGVTITPQADGRDKCHTPGLIAWSKDMVNWEWGGEVFPNRAICITPEKIDGKYWAYWDNSTLKSSWSYDLREWHHTGNSPVVQREGKFDAMLCEAVSAPIVTDNGILLLYNGAMKKKDAPAYMRKWTNSYVAGYFSVYQIGWVLFDRHDPEKVIARSDEPILSPTEPFERLGFVGGTIFAAGMVEFKGKKFLYYGCCDNRMAVAVADLGCVKSEK